MAAVFAKYKFIISGPDITLFKRFKNSWTEINVDKCIPVVRNFQLKALFGNEIDDILLSMQDSIYKKYPRDDYRELLNLVIIFLGGVPSGRINFKKPSAYHMARCIKNICTCSSQFF